MLTTKFCDTRIRLLSQQRLDAIGFQWVVANPNFKSWEERFNDLREYQQLHGTTRVPRSSGTLGEWVHMQVSLCFWENLCSSSFLFSHRGHDLCYERCTQRRLYNKKDPNFLARKAPMVSIR